jgi:hypothetical protein
MIPTKMPQIVDEKVFNGVFCPKYEVKLNLNLKNLKSVLKKCSIIRLDLP